MSADESVRGDDLDMRLSVNAPVVIDSQKNTVKLRYKILIFQMRIYFKLVPFFGNSFVKHEIEN